MRLPPPIPIFALAVVMWTTVLWTMRQRRARLAAYPSPQLLRSHRLHTVAAVSTAVGVTWFFAWLLTDARGPHWLHALSLPAIVISIAVGAALAGYAGWLGGP